MWNISIQEGVARGGPMMWPLAFCSVLAMAIAVERIVVFALHRGKYESVVGYLQTHWANTGVLEVCDQLKRFQSPIADVAVAYLSIAGDEKLRVESAALEASQRIAFLERRLNWLSLIGTLAPMIGLLGTVSGLVDSFQQMESQPGTADPSLLASGIWQALLTTVYGLTIALPAIAVFHYLDSRVNRCALQMEWIVTRLHQLREASQAG